MRAFLRAGLNRLLGFRALGDARFLKTSMVTSKRPFRDPESLPSFLVVQVNFGKALTRPLPVRTLITRFFGVRLHRDQLPESDPTVSSSAPSTETAIDGSIVKRPTPDHFPAMDRYQHAPRPKHHSHSGAVGCDRISVENAPATMLSFAPMFCAAEKNTFQSRKPTA
jgi:hypothetical protein